VTRIWDFIALAIVFPGSIGHIANHNYIPLHVYLDGFSKKIGQPSVIEIIAGIVLGPSYWVYIS
jgi:hypothetical protein